MINVEPLVYFAVAFFWGYVLHANWGVISGIFQTLAVLAAIGLAIDLVFNGTEKNK